MKRRTALIIISAMLLLNACGNTDNTAMKNTVSADAAGYMFSQEFTVAEKEKDLGTSSENIEPSDTTEQSENSIMTDEEFESILENIAFIGDSVTSGYGGYQKVDMKRVFAKPCVGPSNIKDYSFEYGEEEYAALTILSFEQPQYVVISMGLNDINTYSPENFSDLYMDFVDDVIAVCPYSQIYTMSVTPVAADCESIDNTTIDNTNHQLEKTVLEYGNDNLHYVDCSSVLKDENGNMNPAYSGGDGIHLNSDAYDLMLEQLKNIISEE